jgi:hypothetical protein
MKTLVSVLLTIVAIAGCSGAEHPSAPPEELKTFPLDDLEQVRAVTGISMDTSVSSDGRGALRIDAAEPMVVPLFEVTDVSVEEAVLVYQAALRSENLDGKAFLEMWVRIPGKGEFFSRALDRPLTGTMSWMTVAAPFFLQAGQKPDLIRLNLSVQGRGRVWIDDIRLLRAPLPAR